MSPQGRFLWTRPLFCYKRAQQRSCIVRSQERAPSLQVAAGSFNIVSTDSRVRITVIIRIQKRKARPLGLSFVRENALCKFALRVYPVIVKGDILCGSRPITCLPDPKGGWYGREKGNAPMLKYLWVLLCLAAPAAAEVQTTGPPPGWLKSVSCRIVSREGGTYANMRAERRYRRYAQQESF